MSTINDIVEKLASDMEDYIKPSRGFKTEPIIYYGRYLYNEVELPSICFCDTGLDMERMMGEGGVAFLPITVYGYSRWDGIVDNDAIRDLATDWFVFVCKNYTYKDDVLFDPIEIYPGGKERPVSAFIQNIRVKFDFTLTNLNS